MTFTTAAARGGSTLIGTGTSILANTVTGPTGWARTRYITGWIELVVSTGGKLLGLTSRYLEATTVVTQTAIGSCTSDVLSVASLAVIGRRTVITSPAAERGIVTGDERGTTTVMGGTFVSLHTVTGNFIRIIGSSTDQIPTSRAAATIEGSDCIGTSTERIAAGWGGERALIDVDACAVEVTTDGVNVPGRTGSARAFCVGGTGGSVIGTRSQWITSTVIDFTFINIGASWSIVEDRWITTEAIRTDTTLYTSAGLSGSLNTPTVGQD